MKKFLVVALLALASVAQAAEIKVMDKKVGAGNKSATFKIYDNGTAGIKLDVVHMGHRNTITRRSYNNVVSELSMIGGELILNSNGSTVVCGTMGETRVLRLPSLKLNGNCDLVVRRVGSRTQVILKTK